MKNYVKVLGLTAIVAGALALTGCEKKPATPEAPKPAAPAAPEAPKPAAPEAPK